MNRLSACFADGKKKLIVYLTCGDPSRDATVEIVRAVAKAGADVVELGVPFSDPSADGLAIQQAMERALRGGTTLPATLDVCAQLRKSGCAVPLLLFGYYNPIFVRGPANVVDQARDAGVDGFLVVDLPLEEREELAAPARAAGLSVIPLLAPTSPPDRVARVATLDAPFVYFIARTGVTGAATSGFDDLSKKVSELRARVRVPLAVGFGIASAADVTIVGRFADAVVVGSALVKTITENSQAPAKAAARFVAELRKGLDAAG